MRKIWQAVLAAALSATLCSVGATAQAQTTAIPQSAAEASAQQVAHLEGQKVIAVRVVTDTGEPVSQDPKDLPLLAGQPYDSELVRTSLRKLYATGDYADLRAEATEGEGGVRVSFVGRRNLFISVVRVEGLVEPPNESTSLAALRLEVGAPFRENQLQDSLTSLKNTLAEDGLYQAQVRAERSPDPATRRMNILVRVTPGPRARVGAITVQNQTPYPGSVVLARAQLKHNARIDSRNLQRANERLRNFLTKNDYLGARVTIERGTYDAKTNLLPLTLEVVTGLRVRVEVTGARVPKNEVHRRVPVFEEGAVDPDLLSEGQRALQDYFERQGYFEAQVDYHVAESQPAEKKTGGPSEQVITYNVNRGPNQRLVEISFDGEHYFGSSLLKSRLNIQTAAFPSPGRFSKRLLDGDVASVRALYTANGFLGAVVTSDIEQEPGGKQHELSVHFHVQEGPQTLVGKLSMEGNKSISQKEILDLTASSVGEPYSDFNVATDRDNILALYFDHGFPNAQFGVTVENMPVGAAAAGKVPDSRPRVALTYQIQEGEQVSVSQVLIDGYEHARRGMIAREVKVKPGEPLREGDVIETQRELYNLGIFNRVTLAPQNPDGTDPDKAVDVVVEEGKRYTLAYGGGIEAQRFGGSGPDSTSFEFAPLVTLELAKADLTGRGDTLAFKVRASTLQGRALVSYTQPHYFAKPNLSFSATLFADKSRDVTTFTATRYEGSVQLTQKISRATSLVYSYTYRKVLVDAATLEIAPEEIPLFSQPTQVSEFGASWIRDHRDNPADATQGSFNSLDFSLAGKQIGSSSSFTRTFFQNSTYYPLRRRGFVIARSVRFGVQNPLGDTLATDIPLPERFFAGGGTSLRGFGLNQAGPRDPVTGFPVGGEAMLVFNQELRFPMHLPYLGSKLGGALFYDGGNVFSRLGTITWRWSPSAVSQSTGDLSYFSHTVGLGFRYNTPIGPIRVDLAYQLNPAQFFNPCTIGTPGCGANGEQLTRLPHFQLFFNLGDIF